MQHTTRNPGGEAGVPELLVKTLAGENDQQNHTEISTRLQVARLRRRFAISVPLAKTVAFLAYQGGHAHG
jgi:hypothetical protein